MILARIRLLTLGLPRSRVSGITLKVVVIARVRLPALGLPRSRVSGITLKVVVIVVY